MKDLLMKDHFISDDLASNPNVALWLVRPYNFVGWLRQDLELTNAGGSAIGLAAGAAILKIVK